MVLQLVLFLRNRSSSCLRPVRWWDGRRSGQEQRWGLQPQDWNLESLPSQPFSDLFYHASSHSFLLRGHLCHNIQMMPVNLHHASQKMEEWVKSCQESELLLSERLLTLHEREEKRKGDERREEKSFHGWTFMAALRWEETPFFFISSVTISIPFCHSIFKVLPYLVSRSLEQVKGFFFLKSSATCRLCTCDGTVDILSFFQEKSGNPRHGRNLSKKNFWHSWWITYRGNVLFLLSFHSFVNSVQKQVCILRSERAYLPFYQWVNEWLANCGGWELPQPLSPSSSKTEMMIMKRAAFLTFSSCSLCDMSEWMDFFTLEGRGDN